MAASLDRAAFFARAAEHERSWAGLERSFCGLVRRFSALAFACVAAMAFVPMPSGAAIFPTAIASLSLGMAVASRIEADYCARFAAFWRGEGDAPVALISA